MTINTEAKYRRIRLRLVTESNIDEILSETRMRNEHRADPDLETVRRNFENALKQLKAGQENPNADGIS